MSPASRPRLALPLLAVALAGCPIPQPLPDYPAGTITPPRILLRTVVPAASEAVIRVGAGCATSGVDEPSFEMTATLFSSNTFEGIVARWFVNYDAADPVTQSPVDEMAVPAPTDGITFERPLPAGRFGPGSPFKPFEWKPPRSTGVLLSPPYNEAGTIRVVELAVSNGFHPEPSSPKYRQPSANFEVQLHRWVFLLVPGSENCGAHPLP